MMLNLYHPPKNVISREDKRREEQSIELRVAFRQLIECRQKIADITETYTMETNCDIKREDFLNHTNYVLTNISEMVNIIAKDITCNK